MVLFKLRSLLGMNAPCEIFLYLMTHEDGSHPSRIARETYYSQKTVQDTLVDIACSGLVQTYKIGREKRYLLNPNDWLNFLKVSSGCPPLWINWPLNVLNLALPLMERRRIRLKLRYKKLLNSIYQMPSSLVLLQEINSFWSSSSEWERGS